MSKQRVHVCIIHLRDLAFQNSIYASVHCAVASSFLATVSFLSPSYPSVAIRFDALCILSRRHHNPDLNVRWSQTAVVKICYPILLRPPDVVLLFAAPLSLLLRPPQASTATVFMMTASVETPAWQC